MKLFWKLLMGILTIFILSFTLFGTILLRISFVTSLDREKENGLEELRMFQYAFLASLEGASENYTLDEETLRTLAESISQNLGDNRKGFCIYHENGNSIYPVEQQAGELYEILKEESDRQENCLWRLQEDRGEHVLEAMVEMESGGETYYLGMERNIQYVYDSRKIMYCNYRIALLILLGVVAAFSALLSAKVTGPVKRLSQATKAFSKGNYSKRVKPQGKDEVALLMRDFNHMADQLQGNIRELEEAARRQEEFTGAFAHELKTPLTSMIGYGEMLMMMDLPESDRREAVTYIYRESKRLERLSFKMMELIRLREGEISFQTVSMDRLGDTLQKMIVPMMEEKRLRLCCQMERGTILGDSDLLLSLLGNLVDNARKACKEGGQIILNGQLQDNGMYQVTVRDNGCGIPEQELGKITEAFYMVDKSRARREGGAGLGMAICQRIVRLHHAEWTIASTVGEGTEITLIFPGKESGHEDKR